MNQTVTTDQLSAALAMVGVNTTPQVADLINEVHHAIQKDGGMTSIETLTNIKLTNITKYTAAPKVAEPVVEEKAPEAVPEVPNPATES